MNLLSLELASLTLYVVVCAVAVVHHARGKHCSCHEKWLGLYLVKKLLRAGSLEFFFIFRVQPRDGRDGREGTHTDTHEHLGVPSFSLTQPLVGSSLSTTSRLEINQRLRLSEEGSRLGSELSRFGNQNASFGGTIVIRAYAAMRGMILVVRICTLSFLEVRFLDVRPVC